MGDELDRGSTRPADDGEPAAAGARHGGVARRKREGSGGQYGAPALEKRSGAVVSGARPTGRSCFEAGSEWQG